jgi:hypothetical protein
MLVGIAGAIGALTGTAALRHSLYSAGAALAVGLVMIAIFVQVRPSPMGPKAFVALLSGVVLAVAWLVVRSRRRRQSRPQFSLKKKVWIVLAVAMLSTVALIAKLWLDVERTNKKLHEEWETTL